jgi:serine/threonine protein kinase
MSDELKDLINKLLDKDPKTRLGSTTDADEVVNHPWFLDLDWEGLMSKTIDLPFKPDMDKIKNKKVDESLNEKKIAQSSNDDSTKLITLE